MEEERVGEGRREERGDTLSLLHLNLVNEVNEKK